MLVELRPNSLFDLGKLSCVLSMKTYVTCPEGLLSLLQMLLVDFDFLLQHVSRRKLILNIHC
jgi:hypothetical protein